MSIKLRRAMCRTEVAPSSFLQRANTKIIPTFFLTIAGYLKNNEAGGQYYASSGIDHK